MTDHVALVRKSLAGTDGEFDRRVREQADRLVGAFDDGGFDNEAATLGLELEVYAVEDDGENLRLAPIPEDVFDGPADKELGLHNAELNAAPSRFDDAGIVDQEYAVAEELAETRDRARRHGLGVVLDAMWAVPPREGTAAYLDDVEVWGGNGNRQSNDGAGESTESADGSPDSAGRAVVPGGDADDPVLVARNMRQDPRYGALDNEAVRRAGGEITFDVPGASLSFRSILFESLTTSVQPHVQVPDVEAFPRYHNLAIRTLGPLLALSTNSPFLPGDCYDLDAADSDGHADDDITDPQTLVEETHHELRIAAFEQSMNQGCTKVRVPDDLEPATDAVEHVVADDTFAPFLREWIEGEEGDGGAGGDAAGSDLGGSPDPDSGTEAGDPQGEGDADPWEFDYKRGTFWRWVRGVAGGQSVDGACGEQSLRIEYRPLPTQPTVRDVVGLQVLTAGLLRGLVAADHPLAELPWDDAERSFYAAVEDGLRADLEWVTADGDRTDDSAELFSEVFAYARRGLAEQGIADEVVERYLPPLEARFERGMTPSVWKKERVRGHLDDGMDLEVALERMQREYVDLSRQSDSFADWI